MSHAKIYPYGAEKPKLVKGQFHAMIESDTKVSDATFHVTCSGSLFSWDLVQKLGLLHAVKKITSDKTSERVERLIKDYNDLFHGLGKLKDFKVKLHIDKNIKPVAQALRKVPFHVQKQQEEQLERDEALDVIEGVDGPTPWVSPVVVVLKPYVFA